MDIEGISVTDLLGIINNAGKKDFSLNILKKMKEEDKFENIFYLVRIYTKDQNLLTWKRGNFILKKRDFLRFLYSKNKISKKFLRELFAHEDFDDSPIVFHELKKGNDLLKRYDKYNKHYEYDVHWNLLNYFYALYIFNNQEEKKYFFNDFIPERIKDIESDCVTCFFKTYIPYETDSEIFKEFEDIKIYYYDESEKYSFERAVEYQEEEDKLELLFKSKIEEIDDSIDYFIEVEDDLEKVKEYLNYLKMELTDIIKPLK